MDAGVCGRGPVDCSKSLSHPLGQIGEWWMSVNVKRQNDCMERRTSADLPASMAVFNLGKDLKQRHVNLKYTNTLDFSVYFRFSVESRGACHVMLFVTSCGSHVILFRNFQAVP